MVLDYDTPPPRGFKPSNEAFQFWNLAISQGYPYSISTPHFYNQDYRSADNMQHAKEYAIANQQTTTTTTTTGTVPNPVQISVGVTASNSAIVNWSSEDNVNKYHIVLINKDNSQTVREFDISGVPPQTNTTIQNLEYATNYTIYIMALNAFGNSEETNYKFKTLADTTTPTTPTTPTYDFIIESDGYVRVIRLTGNNAGEEIRLFPSSAQTNIDRGHVRLLTAEERAGIDTTTPTITISAEVQAILTKFDNNDYTFPSWFNSNIGYVKDGSITSNEFLAAFNNLLQAGTIIDKTIPVEKEYDVTVLRINEFGGVYSELFYGIKGNKLLELESQFLVVLSDKPRPTDDEVRDFYNFVDTSIDTNMISQSIGAFTLKDGKVTGKIIYIAESAFNSYYYNKPVTSVVQIKDQSGSTIKLKTNNLNFTETQRDETITINEGVGDLNAVKIEFYVWKNVNEPIPFTLPKIDEIVADEIGLDPCPIGQHRDFNNKCVPDDPIVAGTTSLLGKFMGVTALIGTLALLGSKRR
jgi:hypothetical protein